MAEEKKSDFEFPSAEEYQTMVFEDAGELTINLADVKEMKFENVPKGTYSAVVNSAELQMSQSSGKPMIAWKFEITDGEFKGRKLPFWTSFSQKALPGTKANIGRLAPEIIATAFKPEKLCNEGYFTGKPCRIRVDLGEYNGEKRSQIKQILAAAGGGATGDAFFKQ
jgi:hypothetical protein